MGIKGKKDLTELEVYQVTGHLLTNWGTYLEGKWTMPRISDHIHEKTGIRVNCSRIARLANSHSLARWNPAGYKCSRARVDKTGLLNEKVAMLARIIQSMEDGLLVLTSAELEVLARLANRNKEG